MKSKKVYKPRYDQSHIDQALISNGLIRESLGKADKCRIITFNHLGDEINGLKIEMANLKKNINSSELKIYTFYNDLDNEVKGAFHFIAASNEEAIDLADQFSREFSIGKNDNYKIQLKKIGHIKKVEKGYLSLRKGF